KEWRGCLREAAILVGASVDGGTARPVLHLLESLFEKGMRDKAFLVAGGIVRGAAQRGRRFRDAVAAAGDSDLMEKWKKTLEAARQAAGDASVEKAPRLGAIFVLAEDSFELSGPTLKRLLDPNGDLDLAVAATDSLSA